MSSAASSSGSSSESDSSPSAVHELPRRLKRKRDQPQAVKTSTSDSENEDGSDSDSDDEDDETPVLSHAEKRRQKKLLARAPAKPLPKSTKSADGKAAKVASKSKPGAENDADTGAKLKRQHSVWVGNLSFKTTPDGLRTFFDGAGEITRVNMPMKTVVPKPGAGKFKDAAVTKENRGFAYVDFSTPDGKVVAITMSEGHLDGRKLLIKDGDDFTGRPAPKVAEDGSPASTSTSALTGTHSKFAQKVLARQAQPPAPTLFLGNLGFETTEASIREMLTAHRAQKSAGKGKAPAKDDSDEEEDAKPVQEKEKDKDAWIRKIRMGTFEDSGLCKGWAFVDFTSIEHATAVLVDARNHKLDGRALKVEFASADAVRRGGGPGPRPDRPRTKEGGGGPHRADDRGTGRRPNGTRPAAEDKREHPSEQEGHDVAAGEGHHAADGAPSHGRPAKRPRTDTGADRGRVSGGGGRGGKPGAWKGKGRSTPGAALALAQRQSVGIVPSQGTKIKF